MKQPDLYYFEAIKMTSQAWSKFTENTRLPLVFFIQNLTRLVTPFLWLQNSIDQAVSSNNCLLKKSCITTKSGKEGYYIIHIIHQV